MRPTGRLLMSVLTLTLLASATAAFASGQQALVVADVGSTVVSDHELDEVERHATAGVDFITVRLANGQTVEALRSSLASEASVQAVDEIFDTELLPAGDAAVPEVEDLVSASDSAGLATSPCLGQYLADDPWAGWAEQNAIALMHVHEAQARAGHCGDGVTVAVIDTGVDADHPLLAGAVLSGYDFLVEEQSFSPEWSALDASLVAIVEEEMRARASASLVAIVEQSAREIAQSSTQVNASLVAIVETGNISVFLAQQDVETLEEFDLPPLFGHGTMVAGLVRLVAPGAQIMPLRAFDGFGIGDSTDVVRAIYYAVDHGADVINMSFSMDRQSPAVGKALRYARDHGVVVVAAAGNRSSNEQTFPASDSRVVGVASSDDDDLLAEFSNFGPNNADLTAPGVALVSSYPGGLYAAGWGTSFSTPLVSGTAALLRFGLPDDATTHRDTIEDLLNGVEFVGLQGEVLTGGRLDVEGAVLQSLD